MLNFKPKRSIYHRLVIYALALLSLVLTQAVTGIYTLRHLSQGSVELERNWVQGTTLLGDIDFAVGAFRLSEVQRVLAFSDAARAAAEADASRRRAEIAEDERSFKRLSPDSVPAQLAAFDRAWAIYQSDHDR